MMTGVHCRLASMQRFRVLAGLPATGPLPEQFSTTGRGTHREGFVVEFLPEGKSSWVGNFQPGSTDYFAVLPYFDSTALMVFSGGRAYVIDADERRLLHTFGGHLELALVPSAKLLILIGGTHIDAWESMGLRWRTRRISWDGMSDIRVENNKLKGKAWSPIDDLDYPFEVDLATGFVEGGSYNGPKE
jgi:hypothetical protein